MAVRALVVDRAARITGDIEYESIAIETSASSDSPLKHVGGAGHLVVEPIRLIGSDEQAA